MFDDPEDADGEVKDDANDNCYLYVKHVRPHGILI